MTTREDLRIVDVPDDWVPEPEDPTPPFGWIWDPKNKEQAINRIIGMESGMNQGAFDKKIKKYKNKFNITDGDMNKAYKRMSTGGSKRKTRKHRKKYSCCKSYKCKCSCCKSYKCKCSKNYKGRKHGKSRRGGTRCKSHKNKKMYGSRKSR